MNIKPEPLTPARFAKYGRVVINPTKQPTAEASNYKFWSDLANYLIEGETEIGICKVYKQPKIEITSLERHLSTPEILIPIDAPFVVPLLLEGEVETEAKAFTVNIGEALVIDKGVWHGASIPVGKKESSYFVIFRRNTPHEDVEMKDVKPFVIDA